MQSKNQQLQKNTEQTKHAAQYEAIIIYKYKRAFQADPIQQIGINNYPRKKIKTLEQHLAQQMEKKLKMEQKKPEQKSIPEFLLEKVNIVEKPADSQGKGKNALLQKIYNDNIKMRQRIRQSLFNQARGIKTEGIKIVDISQQNFVDFNGKKMQYQSFQPLAYDYYVLRKNITSKQIKKRINLPQEVQFDEEIKKQNSDDSDDSNRQDRSDYDYPDQSSEQRSEKSERSHSQHDDSDQQGVYEKDQENLGDDQLYKRYLKRCKQYKDDDKDEVYEI